MGVLDTIFHFFRGFGGGHFGIDFSAPKGSNIYAVTGGVVTYARNEHNDPNAPSYTRGGGNVVMINVGGNKLQQYAHLDSINVRPGQTILPGMLIGKVGMTGGPSQYYPNIQAPTGPHLHFAIWDTAKDAFVNPLSFFSLSSLKNALGGGTGDQGIQTCAWVDICFPTGHVLSQADILQIIDRLKIKYPAIGSIEESALRSALGQFVGWRWTSDIYGPLQAAINAAAEGREGTVINAIGDTVSSAIPDIPAAIEGFGRVLGDIVTYVLAVVLIIVGVKLYASGINRPQPIQVIAE